MPTIHTSTEGEKSHARGHMYLRAEERHRAETAAAQLTEIRTPPTPPVYQPASKDESQTLTASSPPAPAGPVLTPAAWPSPPRTRPLARRGSLVPAATFGTIAIAATLGIAATLWSGSKAEAPSVSQTAPAPRSGNPAPHPVAGQPKPVATVTPPAQPPVRAVPPVVQASARESAAVMRVSRPSEGQLRVTSTPSGARVTVNGIGWGQTPITIGHLPFGTKTIRVTRDGYTSQQRLVDIRGDQPSATLHLTMAAAARARR